MPGPQPLQPDDPQQIGDYRLTGLLGMGGQGTVYLGVGPDGPPVAIKVLHRRFAGDAKARQRFVREVETAGKVFEFTARVLEAGEHETAPYIVSEYIAGESLEDFVASHGPYEPGALRRLASGTVTALAAIHAAGIVHCDFKPGNILLGSDGPRVIDFGIARALSTVSPLGGSKIGTPAYMAPEQITQGAIGPHTDMFAWASSMVYAATGTPAFGQDDNSNGVMYRIVHDEPDLSAVPDTLRDVVSACLIKQPDRRPAATDVLLSLLGHQPSPSLMPFGAQIGDPLTGHTGAVVCIAYGVLDSGPIAITGSHDHTLRVWDLTTQRQIGDPLTGHTGAVMSVTYGELDDRPIAITGSHDHTLRVWDLTTQRQIGDPLTGHTGAVMSVAYGELDDRAIAISVSADRSVRVWDVARRQQIGPALTRNNTVMSVTCTRLDGRPVAVIGGSYDQAVRVWDLTSRQQMGGPLTGHTSTVMSVITGRLNRRPIAITCSYDQTVRVWDLATRQQTGPALLHNSAVISAAYGWLGSRPIAITSSADRSVRVWDLTTREQLGSPLTVGHHTGATMSVAYGQLDGRPIAITCGGDLAVRIWSLGPPYTLR
ncbi:MAG: hypothetical protein QOE54_6382 [Streptosporangiaceae bacterium]|nr:hypothetical protein [Streptosporangiaceae bacterium]